jgi:tetratricopeptide (TPR) repeat protein
MIVVFLALLSSAAFGDAPALPEKAAKYHAMLIKRPKPGAIYERFTSAWLEEGDITSLRAFLEGKASDAKATTADRLVLGFFLSQQSEHDAAIATFAKALEADPTNAEAWLMRAQAETRVSKFEEAVASLGHVANATGETAIDVAKLKARLLSRTGKTDQALTVLKGLAAAHPEDDDLQDEVVELHLDEGLQAEALDFLKALLERTKDPYQRVLRRLRLGDILKRNDKRDDALAAYSQCLDDAAQDSWVESEVLAQIEQTFRSKDDVTGLKAFLAKLAEKHARRLGLGQLRARILFDNGDGEEAITLHRELVQKNPGNAALKESFIDLLARLQKFNDAVAQCRELLAQRSADKELRIHLATLLYQAKKPGEAMKELQPLIAEPQTPEFEMLRVARLYESFEDPQEARKLYQRAVDTYPASITAQDALASYMHSHKEQLSAVAIWKKQAVAPAIKDEVLRVVRALSSRGEHEAALEVIRAREPEFASDAAYLSQLIMVANSARQPELAVGWALTLIKRAKDGEALDDALKQARPVFRDPKLAEKTIKDLQANSALAINERCLLAELLEQTGDPEGANKALAAASPSDQPVAMRQQARLYMVRQDFERAAVTLEKLATAKKEPEIAEQLAGLWQRNGSYDQALKWIGEWKLLMQGSSRPWMAESRVLQLKQKPEEAVKVLKLAVRRFSDDVSMTTALADAYTANNQLADTQRIYQQLYDEAEDVTAQIRWAGQLADIAQRRSASKELLEAFQERQRSNRTSISPWLAIAEIHRRTYNYEGRRTAMLEASRLKPKDVDLLHQIAKADEDQGEWRKAIETLTAAAALDKTTKSKQRMAEVHLRYGDEETGLRLAFELGGGSNMDPRDAEGMVVGLMSRGNWKSAITVLDPLLNLHADDYRLRYLKMLCLIEDDKTDAAINEAVTLMSARAEVLTPSVSKGVTVLPSLMPEQFDPVTQMVSMISSMGGMALRYRDELRQSTRSRFVYFGGSASNGPQYNFIPQNVLFVKPQVTGLLVRMKTEQSWDAAKVADVVKRLNAAGHPVGEAVQWFEATGRNAQQLSIILGEVEKNMDNTKLAQLWIGQLQSGTSVTNLPPQVLRQLQAKGIKLPSNAGTAPPASAESPEVKLLSKLIEHHQKTQPLIAAAAGVKLWQLDETNTAALDRAVALAPALPVKDTDSMYVFTVPFGVNRETRSLHTPEGKKLRDAALSVMKRYSDAHPEQNYWMMQEPVLHATVGDWEAFVTSLEKALAMEKNPRRGNSFSFGGSVQIQPLNSYHVASVITLLPYEIMSMLMPRNFGNGQLAPMADEDAKPLSKAAARLTNPELRAFIAWRTGDKATFEAFAEKQKNEPKPVLWPLLAKALEVTPSEPAVGAGWLQRARSATTDRDKLAFINAAFVHAVSALMSDGKADAAKPFLKDAQLAVLALRRTTATGSSYEMEQVLKAMESLGMKDEADRQKKLMAAAKATQSSRLSSSVSASSVSPYQIERDIRDGKSATAIPLVVRALRSASAAAASVTSGYSSALNELNQWRNLVRQQPKAAEEIWKQLSSTEATTLKTKLERALLADVLGHSEIAIPIYEEAIKTKPREPTYRLRLAAMLARQSDDPKAAVDHLLAIDPSDLNDVARYDSNLFGNSERNAKTSIRIVRAITRYLEQVKAKVRPGDLEWCEHIVDTIISGSFASSPYFPSLLDVDQKVEDDARGLYDERRQVFDEYCKVAVDLPELGHHLLPAVFALAHAAKQDTTAIVKQARAALAALAAYRNGSTSYGFGGSWEESYNGSSSSSRIWTPQLPEMLLFAAHEQNQEKEFRDQIVPLIRLAYGTDSGTEFELRAKLWFCNEADFLTAVKDMQTMHMRSSNSTEPFRPGGVIEIWKRRGFKVPLTELITPYVKAQLQRNYGISGDEFAPYVQGLAEQGNTAELMALMKSFIATALDKPEAEWKAFLTNNPPPVGNTSGSASQGSPQRRIEQALQLCGNVAGSNALSWIETVTLLHQAGFAPYPGFAYRINGLDSNNMPTKATDLLPVLDRTSWLKNLPDFDPILPKRAGYDSAYERLISALQSKGKGYTDPLVDALQQRQEKSPSFGTALLIGRLVELTPDMTIALQPQAAAFAAMPAQRQMEVLKLIRGVWPSFDRDAAKSAELEPFVAGARKEKLSAANKIIAAKTTQDFDKDDGSFEHKLRSAVADALSVDPVIATQALEHGVKLIMDRQAKGDWAGPLRYNGYSISSGILENSLGLASENETRGTLRPSLDSIGMALRVVEQPDQRQYLTTFDEADVHWGRLLRVFWERSDSYSDPRKATRLLLQELKRALGTMSPALLPGAFRSMTEDVMPRWYRAVVLDEAKKLATGGGELQPLAKELAVGIGMMQRDADAVVHLKRRISDESLHPFTRIVLAALLLERMEADLSSAEVKQSVELIIPALEKDWPGTATVWGPLLGTLSRQPTTPEWEAVRDRLRTAWLHRARFNAEGTKTGRRFEPSRGIAPQILDLFAGGKDEKQLRALYDGCPKAFDFNVETSLVLARHGQKDLLRQVFKASDGELKGNADGTRRVVKFRAEDKAVGAVIDEALKDDARLAMRARIYAVAASDSGKFSPAETRAERLKQEAVRFIAGKGKDKSAADDPMVGELIESVPATLALAPALLPKIAMESVVRRAAQANGNVAANSVLEVPLALALAALSAGDDQAWKAFLVAAKGEQSSSFWSAVSYRVALPIMHDIHERGTGNIAWAMRAMRDVLAIAPARGNSLDEVANVHLVLALLTGQMKEFDAWRKALPTNRVKAGKPVNSLWMEYALEATPPIKGEVGGKVVLALLADSWSREVTHTEINFDYRGRWPQRLDDQSLRAHTAEILNADPCNLAALDAVMNAWTAEKNQRPLLEAVKAVKAKCDKSKHAKALERMAAIEREG